MEKRDAKFIIITIFITLVVTLLFFILPVISSQADMYEKPSFNKYEKMALKKVTESEEYKTYKPENLRLDSVSTIVGCKDCWSFSYSFDVNPDLNSNINSIEIFIEISEGKIKNIIWAKKELI